MKTRLPFKDNKLIRHLGDFPYVWVFFLLLAVAALLAFYGLWNAARGIGLAAMGLLAVLLLTKPMNAVYGLMGTTGSIPLFFATFLLMTVLFAGIYQWGFFQEAGVTFDINQPHIDYGLYAGEERTPRVVELPLRRDTTVVERIAADGSRIRETVVTEQADRLHYQPISFWFTWRNTILTALMQEPVEFFSMAAIYNDAVYTGDAVLDVQKAEAFQAILIFQILISWIFFGVFISLLYSKFRYEL